MGRENKTRKLRMRFTPNTIEHLGVRMYSTLPPVVSELIANSYDADAKNVSVHLKDSGGVKEIVVSDDGHGMTFEDIDNRFLIIGRNRRSEDGSDSSPAGRKIIGKKGLGKLSFFGIAHEIEIQTIKDGKRNTFVMSWEKIMEKSDNDSLQDYEPDILELDESTDEPNGTRVTLSDIQRESDFDANALADSISRYFILVDDFSVTLQRNDDESITLDNKRRYSTLSVEVEWDVPSEIPSEIRTEYSRAANVTGHLLATEKPISPNTNMRGITLFSRKKLVNAPEYFSDSTSSHFFNYLTGWLEVDFIDDFEEDVIGTNRQSLNWDHPEMVKLKGYLQDILKWLERDWRKKREKVRRDRLDEELKKSGITIGEWQKHVPDDLRDKLTPILEAILQKSEFTKDEISGTVESLKDLVPPYTYYHYQNLHPSLSVAVFDYYKDEDYYNAVAQGVIKYIRDMESKSSSGLTDIDLIKHVFSPDLSSPPILPEFSVTKKFKRPDGTEFDDLTKKSIAKGHGLLARAIWSAFRNPIHHELAEDLRDSGLYTERDCLDALGLLSHLFRRLEDAEPS